MKLLSLHLLLLEVYFGPGGRLAATNPFATFEGLPQAVIGLAMDVSRRDQARGPALRHGGARVDPEARTGKFWISKPNDL